YYQGARFISERQNQLNHIREAVSILGIIIVGALIASNVKVTTPLVLAVGDSKKPLQEVFDSILPNLLPVLSVAAVYFGLNLKKLNTVRMVWLMVIVSLLLALCGLIA
uniref:PTS system mannose/fructose/sorbose family transporter subunit IID n=1 Tax=Dysgonomonas capnocytophagoides TaxID=45254 RepID=UPI002A810492